MNLMSCCLRKAISLRRWGPLLLLMSIAPFLLTGPWTNEPAMRVAVVNGARPEFLLDTMRILITGTSAAESVVVVFADKREYDVAVRRFGSVHTTVAHVDVLLVHLGCNPLQIQATHGIMRTGKSMLMPPIHPDATPASCVEDGAIPAATATLLSSTYGGFLLDAAGLVLQWGIDGGFFAADAAVVVLQPAEAVPCQGGATQMFLSSSVGKTCRHGVSGGCVRLVALGRNSTSIRGAVPAFSKHSESMLQWWRRVHPPRSLLHQHGNNAGDWASNGVPVDVEVASPFVFVGTLHGIVTFSQGMRAMLLEWPVPPGYSHELPVTALAASASRQRGRWLPESLDVGFLPAADYIVGSLSSCRLEASCRGQHAPAPLGRPDGPAIPLMFVRSRICPKQRPLQPPKVHAPCQSGLFDDVYLLHRAVHGGEITSQPMDVLPIGMVTPQRVAERWKRIATEEERSRPSTAAALPRVGVRDASPWGSRRGPALHAPSNAAEEANHGDCIHGMNAVLGMCGSYEPSVVGPFVRSFIKFHRRGCTKLLLFVDEDLVEGFRRAYGVEEDIEIISTAPMMPTLKLKQCGPAMYRKELFARWLEAEQRRILLDSGGGLRDQAPFRFVMMADTRDIFFQTDPFDPLDATLVPYLDSVRNNSTGTERRVLPSSSSTLFLIAERFEAASVDLYNSIVHSFQERFGGGSCGASSLHWSYRLQLVPLIAPPSHKRGLLTTPDRGGQRGEKPVEPLPAVCSGMYLGTFNAVKDFLFILSESLIARVDGDSDACAEAPLDQGMFNCLLHGGLAHAKFAHDVVLLNPYTQPYTHMFRSDEDIRFGEDSDSSNAYSFVRTCPNTPRRFAEGQREAAPPSQPYAAVHQADRHGELYFYASEVMTQQRG